jgi:hypothetical protein
MTAPPTRPGVEASGRSFRTISEGLGVEEPVVPPAYLWSSEAIRETRCATQVQLRSKTAGPQDHKTP